MSLRTSAEARMGQEARPKLGRISWFKTSESSSAVSNFCTAAVRPRALFLLVSRRCDPRKHGWTGASCGLNPAANRLALNDLVLW